MIFGTYRYCYFFHTALISLSLTCLASTALAACDGTSGTVTCTGTITSTVGAGRNDSIKTLNLAEGATINTSNVSISMGTGTSSNPNVLNIGGTVQGAGIGTGPYNTGPNVIEFGGNTVVNIKSTGRIIQTGGANNGETFNPTGGNNTINNYGSIETTTSSAIWFEGSDTSTAGYGNTINNYGTIRAGTQGTGTVVGNSGNGRIVFTNNKGAVVKGNVALTTTGSYVNLVTLYNGSTVTGSIGGGGGGAILTLTGDDATDTLNNTVTGFSTVNKSGSGTWIVGAPSRLSGLASNVAVNINAGTLVLAGNESSSQTKATIASGATLQLGEGGTSGWIDYINANNGTLAFNRSDTVTYATNIAGTGNVTQIGGGTTILTANNGYTGTTTISSGTLQLGNGNTTGRIASSSAIVNNGTLAVNHSDAVSIAQSIGGSGAFTQSGTGTTTLTGANTYSGATTISRGTLALSGSGTVEASSGVHNNGTLDISNISTSSPSLKALDGTGNTILGQKTLTLTNANSTFGNNYAGIMSGTGGLIIAAGTQTLSGQNTYTGTTEVAQKVNLTLSGRVAGALNNTGTTDVKGGAVGGATDNTGTLTAENGTFQAITNSGTAKPSNSQTGDITNTGTLTLDGTTSSGNVTLQSGSFTVTASNASANAINENGNGTLNGTLTLRNATGTYSGVFSGTGGLAIAGGTQLLTGNSTYSGATSIGSGAHLTLGDGGTSGFIGNTTGIANDGELTINHSDKVTLHGAISGAGRLNQVGSGTTILSGNNSYTGGTTVAAGILQVDGDQSGATGDLDVQSGAQLHGKGVIGGNVTIADNATLSPGEGTDSVGTLKVNGNLTLAYNAVQNWNLGQANAEGGQNNDLVAVKGDLVFSGTINVTGPNKGSEPLGQGIYRIYTYEGSLSGAVPTASYRATANGAGEEIGPNGRLGSVETAPGTTMLLQTSIDHQINLVVSDNVLTFWDGGDTVSPGPGGMEGNNTVNGGDGTWTTDNGNWTDVDGGRDGAWTQGTFALFAAQAGTVTVRNTTHDGAASNVLTRGMQFANNDGGVYKVTGDDLYATTGTTTIRVGDGTQQGASISAVLDTVINDSLVANGTSLVKSDAGTLILTKDQNYRGETSISSGTLQLGDGGTSGRITRSAVIHNNGKLVVNFSDDLALTQPIDGKGRVEQAGSGKTTLNDRNNYAGGTAVTHGTLQGTASSFGTGGIDVGQEGHLIVNQQSAASLANALSGAGRFIKTGAGDITINRDNAGFTGQVDVQNGGLGINGNMAQARFNVQDGGTLSGAGTIGATQIAQGGVIAPGNNNAIGTLTVNQNLSMARGTVFRAEGNGQSSGTSITDGGKTYDGLKSDRVKVAGDVSLNGGMVNFNVARGAVLKARNAYTILEATGSLSGQFDRLESNISEQYLFLKPSLFYVGNLVGIKLDGSGVSFAAVSHAQNGIAIGRALDKLPETSPLALAFTGLSQNDARDALNAVSGEIHASIVTALIEDAYQARETVAERLASAECEGAFSSGSMQTATLRGDAPDPRCYRDRVVLWHQAYGSLGRNFGNENVATMNHTTAGFMMGADAPIFETARIGALFGYSNSSFHISNGRASSGHSNNLMIGGYGGNHWGHVNLRLGATYSWNLLGTNRTILFNGYQGSHLDAGYLSGTAQAFGEVGYRIRRRRTIFEPFAGISYVNVHNGSFREHDGPEAVTGRASTAGVTFSTFGLRSSATYHIGRAIIMPRLMIGYRHSFGPLTPHAALNFATSSDANMSVMGTGLASDVAVVDAGISLKVTDSINVGLFYLGQYGVQAIDSGIRGNLVIKF
ncbi:autotransporter domain-containing protein [Candidatus Kirkpatrickella diaphorinae]|uniref:Autotransporter domain-containing protein n=1 Tax=Candidatus Kirkpatrickella diaphorinae TaxID=2984322 RepID=A0ABY6GH79_9PROT|nr:autotransporter domain-containing protein [Candidatus Kirkpatrickella diaphorinae]UYH50876.1 autotransporter domain-containing protein [Candidatus Kirkpatrickella diaphorinae]